jgi:iron complex outermembrane receptor protein
MSTRNPLRFHLQRSTAPVVPVVASQLPLKRPLAHAVGGAMLLLAFGLPMAQSALAQTSGNTGAAAHNSGSLDAALDRFAREARITLTYDAAALRGLRAPELNGSYTVDAGLTALLVGSGMTAVRLAGGEYAVRAATTAAGDAAAASSQLPTITVKDNADAETGLSPVAGNVARVSRVGTKTDTALKETPQAISVITRDQMDAQGVESIAEGLRYTPGVVAQYGNTDLRYDWLTVRGFVPGRYLDGLRLPFGARGYSQPRIEPFGLERVEVLKGPSSLLYGQANPGGLVNMVSKRPTTDTVREVELQYGSYNRKQIGIDLGGKIDEAGELSYRFVALGRKSDTAYDYVSEEKTYIAPSLTWRPNADTRLTLLAQYQKIDSKGGGGAPVLTANGTLYTSRYAALDRSSFAGEPNFDRFTNEQYFLGYELEHNLNDNWSLRQNLRYGEVDADTRRVQVYCRTAACDPANLGRYAWAFPEKSRLFTVDNQLQGKFNAGATRHTLLVGVDYSSERTVYDETTLSLLSGVFNAYAPVYGTYGGAVPPVATHIEQDRDQLGAYVQDQIRLERWTLVAGGRYDWADTSTRTVTSAARSSVKQSDSAFTGRLGLLYSFDNGITPYVSYSTSFQPTVGTSRTLEAFKPTKGQQYEAGLKYQPDGSKTMVTLSAYQLTQQNVTTPDPLNTSFNEQTGEVRVRGLELEGKMQLQKGLDLIASYGYTDSKITKANPTSAGVNITGNRLAFVPRNQASAWLDYTVQNSDLAGLGAGVGARYLGENFGDNANVYHMPGVTLFDAALRYDFGKLNPQLKGLRMALNASNIFNKTYVAACLGTTGCYYGDGRSVYLTMKYGW